MNENALITLTATASYFAGRQVRRLTVQDPIVASNYLIVTVATASETGAELKSAFTGNLNFQYAQKYTKSHFGLTPADTG